MRAREALIRRSIIPDISVKMLDLCLSDDENGILMPITKRKSHEMEFRSDWALQEVISTRIKSSYKALPLALRKRKIFEDSVKNQKEKTQLDFEAILNSGKAPIIMRKYMLYKQARAS